MPRDAGARGVARSWFLACACMVGMLGAGHANAQSRLLAPTADGSELAFAVALDGQRIVAGAPGADARRGIVYSYECDGQGCTAADPVLAAGLDDGALFGAAVSISADTLAIGAPGQGSGTVYVFIHDGIDWSPHQQLVANPVVPGARFGASVAVLGERLVIGAPDAANDAGAVYVFERVGGTWSQTDLLVGEDTAAGDALGSSVALAADTVLAGAPHWAPSQAGAFSQGAAYVFTQGTQGWAQQARLLSPSSDNGQLFGHAVALSGNRAVIGAPLGDLGIGNAHVFERAGSEWTPQAQLATSTGLPGDRFGWSVALDGDQALIGAPFSREGCGDGARFVFAGGAWNLAAGPVLARPLPGGLVGWSVAAQGQRFLVGVPGYSGAPSHVGAASWHDGGDAIFNDGYDDAGAELCLLKGD